MATVKARLDTERAVRDRYGRAARQREASLCCPMTYDRKYLAAIPQEILQKDYGCGDPTPFVKAEDTVLDLGSGAGKMCFIAAQIAGPSGKVIGVDFHPDMLALARKYQPEVARRLGYDNVRFVRARIQDLGLALDDMDKWLERQPVRTSEELASLEAFVAEQRRRAPAVADESVDVIVSNCVLNLVREEDRVALFREMFRVLKRGGRVAISDIVSDERVPEEMRQDAKLWGGCIGGAHQEAGFLAAFERAGFHAIQIARYDEAPWRTVEGIEFRSMTVTARKGKQGPCLERRQAVIYKGPWKKVEDDDGHVLQRGVRIAVCDKTFRILTGEPYGGDVIPVEPRRAVPMEKAEPFACGAAMVRSPAETKGNRYRKTTAERGCEPGCC